MFNSLFHPSVSILELLIRVVAVYVCILVLIRLSGKREVGQFSAIEFVSILLISNAVQNAMNAGDNSLVGGLILALGLIVMSWGISKLSYRFKGFRRIVEGTPTILVRHGTLIEPNLRKEQISHEELHILLRKQGITDLKLVELAILESDGQLTLAFGKKPSLTEG